MYIEGEPDDVCRHMRRHYSTAWYGARGRVRNSSAHAIENYNTWKSQERKKAEDKETSSESSSSPSGGSDPPPQRRRLEDKEGGRGHHYAGTGKDKSIGEHNDAGGKPQATFELGGVPFVSSRDYTRGEGKRRCTEPHQDDSYGAPNTRSRLGERPSPHARENFKAFEKQISKALNLKAAAVEASSSSGKSKSPAHHEEKREREREHERRGQSSKSQGKKSGDSSKQKDDKSKDDQSSKSHGKKSAGSSKPKNSGSKDDTHGGGRRRERRS